MGCKLNIFKHNGVSVVSAREIHKILGSSERFSKWYNRNINYYNEIKSDIQELTYKHPDNNQDTTDYLISPYIAKSILLTIRNNKMSGLMLESLDQHIIVHHTRSRFEYSFGDVLKKQLSVFCLSCESQKNILGYRIDFYIPELNIAVEYDEIQHYTKTNRVADKERESAIKKEIGCKFIRVDWETDDATNAAIVIKKIFNI